MWRSSELDRDDYLHEKYAWTGDDIEMVETPDEASKRSGLDQPSEPTRPEVS